MTLSPLIQFGTPPGPTKAGKARSPGGSTPRARSRPAQEVQNIHRMSGGGVWETSALNEERIERLRRYVENIGRGMDSFPAAKAAGYSDSYAEFAAHRLMKKPEVAQAIESIREEGRTMAIYGLVEAMKEADDAATFAKLHKNPMANVKACELRAKLSGLLIDRVEVVEVDLRGALEAAERRVIDVTPLPLSSRGPIDGRPHIPGNPVADPE